MQAHRKRLKFLILLTLLRSLILFFSPPFQRETRFHGGLSIFFAAAKSYLVMAMRYR